MLSISNAAGTPPLQAEVKVKVKVRVEVKVNVKMKSVNSSEELV